MALPPAYVPGLVYVRAAERLAPVAVMTECYHLFVALWVAGCVTYSAIPLAGRPHVALLVAALAVRSRGISRCHVLGSICRSVCNSCRRHSAIVVPFAVRTPTDSADVLCAISRAYIQRVTCTQNNAAPATRSRRSWQWTLERTPKAWRMVPQDRCQLLRVEAQWLGSC